MSQALELGEELGVGAVATVHRAIDRGSGRHYALKLLHDRNARDPTAARRFAREAELARTLRDPHIVEVHGAIEFEGRPALLMELVEGPTLAELIAREAPVPEAELLSLARDLAQGLRVAHDGGVMHRDLKPANVLICGAEAASGRRVAKIADFGMARATSLVGVDREAMTVLGTPDYMAPETLDPLAVDPRTDLYALGCILFEMATGRPPYSGQTPFAVLEAHRRADIPELPAGRYSARLRELIARLLAKEPSDRPHAASAVVEALDAIREGGAGSTGQALGLAPVPGGEHDEAREAVDALVRARPRDLLDAALSGRCARCGAPVIRGVGVCLDCGFERVQIERGRFCVFVNGPGQVADKMHSAARDRLLAWLRSNPDTGLDATRLARRIPRLPFALVVGVSERSGQALVASLTQLGIYAEVRRGGRMRHPNMLSKAVRVEARRFRNVLALIVVWPLLVLLLAMVLPILPFYLGAAAVWSSLPALELADPRAYGGGPALALPPAVRARIGTIEGEAPKLGPRHRPGLRAVVQRVLALTRATPEGPERESIDGEMDHALVVAMVATRRLDELDAVVSRPDFDPGDPEQRRELRERDMWAARLLELTATLDSLVARQSAAREAVAAAGGERDAELDELRLRVEALEEINRT